MTGLVDRARLRTLAPLIGLIGTSTLALVGLAVVVVGTQADDPRTLFQDVYETTGSRLTGLVSMVGVVLLATATAVCLFAARLVPSASDGRWRRWLLGAGVLTGALALDDYLAIHELADDLLAPALGIETGRALKNVLEGGVLGGYGILLGLLFWRFRSIVAATDWVLFAIAVVLLGASLAADLAPRSVVTATVGLSIEAQDVIEDTLKVLGLAFYTAYLIRASAQAVRSRGVRERPDADQAG